MIIEKKKEPTKKIKYCQILWVLKDSLILNRAAVLIKN